MLYRVKWEIDIEATDPIEAAREARGIQLDHESIANVFDVALDGKHIISVDLEDIQNHDAEVADKKERRLEATIHVVREFLAFNAKICEAVARQAGWAEGGGYIYDAKVFDSWKAAVSWAGEDEAGEEAAASTLYANWKDCAVGEGLFDQISIPENRCDTVATLVKAGSFIAGFEDDETQEGIAELLAGLQVAIEQEVIISDG